MEKSKTKVQGKGKRLLSVVLAALTIGSTVVTTGSLTGVGISASAVTDTAKSSASDFIYSENYDGTITVNGYEGSKTDVVIPSKINGKSVTKIGATYYYDGWKRLSSVTIPDSVKSIGYCAFQSSKWLTSVKIGKSVTVIDEYAFRDCTRLKSVTIPNGVTKISNGTFLGCTELKSVTIPNSVTSIGYDAFNDCKGLTSVTIGNKVKTICQYAFCNCTSLKSLKIPDSVTKIDKYAFSECSSLESVNIPSGITGIEMFTFENCTSLKSITIPDSVKSIGSWAFEGCKGLKSVKISNGVTSINKSVFEGCAGLTSITIPNSVTDIYTSAFEGCTGLKSITFSNKLKTIDPSAFKGCTGLTNVTIPDSVLSIGSWAFEDCTGLKSVKTGEFAEIGTSAFEGCTGLTNVTIGNKVEKIGKKAFCNCKEMKTIIIPESVSSIGDLGVGYNWLPYPYFESEVIKDLKIYGVTGSYAETYANDNKIDFVEMLVNKSKISSSTIDIGKTVTLNAAATGGTKSYKYAFYVKSSSASKWTTIQSYSTNTQKTWKPDKAGKYQICISVNDGNITVEKRFNLDVVGPLANTSKISSSNIYKGNSVTITGAATGGKTPYKYSFAVKLSSSKSWTTIQSYSTNSKKTWKPDKTGKYDIRVNVTDGKSTVSKTFTVNVSAPLVNTSKISKSTINKGESITITGAATGGTKSYKYEMYVKSSSAKNWTKIKSYSTTAKKTWKPDKTGKYYIRVNVNDGKTTVSKTLTLNILSPLTNKSTVSKTNVKKGSTITLKAAATGGKSPYKYTFTYRNSNSKTWKTLKSNTSSSTYSVKMNKAGKYYFNIYVKDSTGKSVKKTFTVTVK